MNRPSGQHVPPRFLGAAALDQPGFQDESSYESTAGEEGLYGEAEKTLSQDAQNGCPARPQPKNRPEAYPLGYVEDLFEGRTKLADIFSILPTQDICGSVGGLPSDSY
jgi:hypothetical protein